MQTPGFSDNELKRRARCIVMNRLLGVAAPLLLVSCAASGCERRDPLDPHEFVAEETARVAQASASRRAAAAGAHVTCRCDDEGDLHVVAPAGSIVTTPSDPARADAEADIIVPSELSEAPGTRLRHTVSLGFAGDGKLTETPSYGGYGGGFHGGGLHGGGSHGGGHGGHGGR
jgi:hypothetical protein